LREPCSAPTLLTPATSAVTSAIRLPTSTSSSVAQSGRQPARGVPDGKQIDAARILMRSGCQRPSLAKINYVVAMKQFILSQHLGSSTTFAAEPRPADLEVLLFEQVLERANEGNYRVLKSEDLRKYVSGLLEPEKDQGDFDFVFDKGKRPAPGP